MSKNVDNQMNITSEKKGIINFTIHLFWAGRGGGCGGCYIPLESILSRWVNSEFTFWVSVFVHFRK